MTHFASGTRIGDYVIDSVATGGNVELSYHATHVLLPRRARLQILHPAFVGLRPVAVQMMREGCILEALHHVGVPRMYECGVLPDHLPWMATELVEGTTIAQAIADRPMPVADVIGLLRDVAEVLDHAHRRGVVHRNIRPEAIVKCGPTRGFPICVVDWGDARIHDGAMHQVIPTGSQYYRAPELASGEAYDGRADVYALGVVAYEALTRTLPMMSAAKRCPGAPPRVTALLDRMLAVDPIARPTAAEVRASASELAELVELEVPDDELTLEATEDVVVLVELADEPIPPVISRKLRWTPPQGIGTRPAIRRAMDALKRGRP